MELTSEQQHAVNLYKTCNFLVVDGGPGVGKTTTIKHLAGVRENVVIIAPTGAAADRISSATGLEAFTFEKIAYTSDLIERFKHFNVITDESSMIPMEDFVRLFHYLVPASICIVGDKDQLPNMSGTAILRTLVSMKDELAVVQLTINHRQRVTNSGLIQMIQALKLGGAVVPIIDESLNIVLTSRDSDAIEACARQFLTLPNAQMLAYTNKAVDMLNDKTKYSTNQRVVCTRNLYDAGTLLIANACTGQLSDDGNVITYSNGYIDQKVRNKFASQHAAARAMTVKKSQGNEFDVPGLVVMTTWNGAVPRELSVTALSRFKEKVTIFCTRRCLEANLKSEFSTSINEDVRDMITKIASKSKRRKI